jgi:hypothetical protein
MRSSASFTPTSATGMGLSWSSSCLPLAQHNPLLRRHRKARGDLVMTWLHANHGPPPVEPPTRGATGGRKKGLEPDGSVRRRKGGREDERSSDAEVARQSHALLESVPPIPPGENYRNFQFIAFVFSRLHEGDSTSGIQVIKSYLRRETCLCALVSLRESSLVAGLRDCPGARRMRFA